MNDTNDLPIRFGKLTDLCSAGCDPDFDQHDNLEWEFSKLRRLMNHSEEGELNHDEEGDRP